MKVGCIFILSFCHTLSVLNLKGHAFVSMQSQLKTIHLDKLRQQIFDTLFNFYGSQPHPFFFLILQLYFLCLIFFLVQTHLHFMIICLAVPRMFFQMILLVTYCILLDNIRKYDIYDLGLLRVKLLSLPIKISFLISSHVYFLSSLDTQQLQPSKWVFPKVVQLLYLLTDMFPLAGLMPLVSK